MNSYGHLHHSFRRKSIANRSDDGQSLLYYIEENRMTTERLSEVTYTGIRTVAYSTDRQTEGRQTDKSFIKCHILTYYTVQFILYSYTSSINIVFI